MNPAGTPLGTFKVGQVVTFDVPAGTSSITIIEQANGTTPDTVPPDTVTLNRTDTFPGITIENTAVPDKVTNPGGNVVYDDNPPSIPADPSGLTAFFQSAAPVTGAFTIPNTSTLLNQSVNGLPAGKWSFVVNDFGYECVNASNCCIGPTSSTCKTGGQGTTYKVSVVLKGGAPRTSGTLDVAFHLVGLTSGGAPLTAAKAPTDPSVRRMVSSLASLYAKTGICLGTVTFYDLPDWAEARYGSLDIDSLGTCDDMSQMFTLSAPGNHLNFFLVGAFVTSTQGQVQIAGIDGTIPGPSAFSGTIHSGAVVNGADLTLGAANCGGALDILRCGADEVAYITAHEGGHWMGLYHTTEQLGDAFDPIADTGKCPCTSCVPQASRGQCSNFDPNVQPILNGTTCTKSSSCAGGDNLMFWLLDNASTGALTCEQGGVIRANPVVH
ncbi:MAG: hypothetical protein ACJ783_17400 [Myxococcales bacterium]